MASFLFLAAGHLAFACGPLPTPGPGRPFFDWSMCPDARCIDVLTADFPSDGFMGSPLAEAGSDSDELLDGWVEFLGTGDPTARESMEAALDAEDPAKAFRVSVVPALAVPPAKAGEAEAYLALLLKSRKLDDGTYAGRSPLSPAATLAADATRLLVSLKSPFVRERVALVAVKAETLAGNPDAALRLYETHFRASPQGAARARASGWKARALLDKGLKKEAMLEYVALFDGRSRNAAEYLASIDFVGPDEALWEAVAAAAKPGRARAAAHFARALLDPHRMSSRHMRAMLAEDPGSGELVKLLVRAMRELDWQAAPDLYARAGVGRGSGEGLDPGLAAKVDDLLALCREAVAGGKTRDPGLFAAAGARLLTLKGDFAGASAFLGTARKIAPFGKAGGACADFHAWMAAVGAGSSAARDLLGPALAALESRRTEEWGDSFTDEGWAFLGMRALERGRTADAVIAFSKTRYRTAHAAVADILAEEADLRALALGLPDADAETKALLKAGAFDPRPYRYSLGVRLTRAGRYGEAAETLAALPAGYWAEIAMIDYGWLDSGENRAGMVSWTEGDFVTGNPVPRKGSRLDAVRSLAAAEARGDLAAVGWAWMSTPYLGYDDVSWQGSLVGGASDWALSSWPFAGGIAADRFTAAKRRFLAEYDSTGRGAALLFKAMGKTRDREERARLALGAAWGLSERPYSPTLGEPPRDMALAKNLAAALRGELAGSKTVREYAKGCPGLLKTR